MTENKEDRLQGIGRNAMASIREMVAALECDYERLEELRDERQTWIDAKWEDDDNGAPADGKAIWSAEFPDEAEELKELEEAAGECKDQDDAETRIQEDAPSLEFRSGWVTDKGDLAVAEEFCLLLTTGGPAVRILGELDRGEPTRACLQVQDWGTPWTDYYEDGCGELLLAYARCFCMEG